MADQNQIINLQTQIDELRRLIAELQKGQSGIPTRLAQRQGDRRPIWSEWQGV